jgi:hypothetical protein
MSKSTLLLNILYLEKELRIYQRPTEKEKAYVARLERELRMTKLTLALRKI